jgi:twinkle protein
VTIVSHDEIAGQVLELWESGGLPRGDLPGWPSVNHLYSVALGQWTLITGWPGSGKSEWLDAVMVNLAKTDRWRFVIFSPENWPLALHHSKIIEKYCGKPFNPGPTERVDLEDLEIAEKWISGKFFFAKPNKPDIFSILEESNKFASKAGEGYHKLGVVLDPWNHLEHHRPHGMSETEYVSQTLSEIIRWVRERDCHLWLVAHPSKLQRTKEGSLPIPTPHDISGSVHFWNKADNCIAIARDQKDYTKQEVDVHVQKIRFKHIGRVGLTQLLYDRVTGRYSEPPKDNVVDLKSRAAGVQDF